MYLRSGNPYCKLLPISAPCAKEKFSLSLCSLNCVLVPITNPADYVINNNNNNNNDNVYGSVIMAKHFESSPGSYDGYGTAPSGRQPAQTRPTDPGCEFPHRVPEATPTTTIYYYSIRELILILQFHGG